MEKSDNYLRDVMSEQAEALSDIAEKLMEVAHLTIAIKNDYKYMVDMVIEQLAHKDKLNQTYVNDDPSEIVSGE